MKQNLSKVEVKNTVLRINIQFDVTMQSDDDLQMVGEFLDESNIQHMIYDKCLPYIDEKSFRVRSKVVEVGRTLRYVKNTDGEEDVV